MTPASNNGMTTRNGGHSDVRTAAYEEGLRRLNGVRLFSQRLTQAQSSALTTMESDEIGAPEDVIQAS